MKIKKVSDILNESKSVGTKDWERMLNLVVTDDSGDSVAKSLKDKDKAISRFVAGLKLLDSPLEYKESWGEYIGDFNSFGNKALSLGATVEEIKNIYDNTEAPSEYIDRIKQLSGKKLKNRFVSSISKAVLDLGFDINYLPHNGYAITFVGKEAMEKNGRKWTIGYKSEILYGDKKFKLVFDVITDEGDGPSYYVVDPSSDKIFTNIFYAKKGKLQFISFIKEVLKKEI